MLKTMRKPVSLPNDSAGERGKLLPLRQELPGSFCLRGAMSTGRSCAAVGRVAERNAGKAIEFYQSAFGVTELCPLRPLTLRTIARLCGTG